MSKQTNIRTKLTLASATLLQVGSAGAADAQDAWDVSSAILIYQENDGRVTAIEPVINGRKEIADGEMVNIKLVLDALTGASPTGAKIDTTTPQTFTTPSGNADTVTTVAGETPLDDTFHDTRVAVSGSWEMPVIDEYSRVIVGGNVSKEFDYMSLGISANFLRDYNNRNTTLSAALGLSSDTISPSGGIPIPFENMRAANSGFINRDGSDDSKTISDLIFGVTQVINRSTLMQFNLGLSSTSGYMNDPYKVISLVDGSGNLITPSLSDERPYEYESRPDSRSRTTFYWKTVHHLTEDVINLSYRYYTDDWGIDSHTIDFHYRYELGNGSYLQPHLRYYTQTAADFYTTSLVDTAARPEFASADYRLGEFVTNTYGLKYGMPTGENSEFTVRAEVISQVQSDDITADLDSFILQFGYDFRF